MQAAKPKAISLDFGLDERMAIQGLYTSTRHGYTRNAGSASNSSTSTAHGGQVAQGFLLILKEFRRTIRPRGSWSQVARPPDSYLASFYEFV